MELMIVAGEASGDARAAELIAELRRRHPELRFFGCGGERMAAAGCELLVAAKDLAVVGLFEVVRHLPRIHGFYRRLKRAMKARRPVGLILVDFPDFNLRLAADAHRSGVAAVYFISPQLWAWRSGRVKTIRRYIRRMICIFPFEAAFYAQHQMEVAAVGHPLVERVAEARPKLPDEAVYRAQNGLDASATLVALLPGSRRREIGFHLPTLLEAARRLHAQSDLQFVIPAAPTLEVEELRGAVPPPMRGYVKVLEQAMYPTLEHARLAIVASGTATVETALFGTPMVVVYRLSEWTYRLGRRWVKTPYYAMVNLIAGRQVVPELIQKEFDAAAIVNWTGRLLGETEERRQMCAGLEEVRRRLGPPGAIERAATAVEQALWAQPIPQPPKEQASR